MPHGCHISIKVWLQGSTALGRGDSTFLSMVVDMLCICGIQYANRSLWFLYCIDVYVYDLKDLGMIHMSLEDLGPCRSSDDSRPNNIEFEKTRIS